MAVTYHSYSVFTDTDGGSTSTQTYSYPTGLTDGILLVLVKWDNNGGLNRDMTSVTYNSVAMTLFKSQRYVGGQEGIAAYTLTGAATGSNSLVVTMDGNMVDIIITCIALEGAHQTFPMSGEYSDPTGHDDTDNGASPSTSVILPNGISSNHKGAMAISAAIHSIASDGLTENDAYTTELHVTNASSCQAGVGYYSITDYADRQYSWSYTTAASFAFMVAFVIEPAETDPTDNPHIYSVTKIFEETTGDTLSESYTFPTGLEDPALLVLVGHYSSNVDFDPGLTYNSVAMTEIHQTSSTIGGGAIHTSAFILANPATGANTLAGTLLQPNPEEFTHAWVLCAALEHIDQTTPHVGTPITSESSTGLEASVSYSATNGDNLVICAFTTDNQPANYFLALDEDIAGRLGFFGDLSDPYNNEGSTFAGFNMPQGTASVTYIADHTSTGTSDANKYWAVFEINVIPQGGVYPYVMIF